MHPAPARIDAPPRVSSQLSWNPAVPPPPVAGATAGNGVAEGVRVGDGRECVLGVGDELGVADELREVDELRVADELALGVAVALVAEVEEMAGDAEALVPGVNFGSVAEGVEAAQATTNAEITMVMLAKPTAVSLAPSPGPAVVRRIFMGLLMPAADDGPGTHRRR
jgi:hypothetical protein